MSAKIISFGYSRHALKPQADKTIDVRGFSHDLSQGAVDDLIEDLARAYVSGQSVAIGCDEGQHRAPEIARRLAERLKLTVKHRDR